MKKRTPYVAAALLVACVAGFPAHATTFKGSFGSDQGDTGSSGYGGNHNGGFDYSYGSNSDSWSSSGGSGYSGGSDNGNDNWSGGGQGGSGKGNDKGSGGDQGWSIVQCLANYSGSDGHGGDHHDHRFSYYVTEGKGHHDGHGGDWNVSCVPLPASLPLFGSALALMSVVAYRRKTSLKSAFLPRN